jgi:hypothetical protein
VLEVHSGLDLHGRGHGKALGVVHNVWLVQELVQDVLGAQEELLER